MDFTHSLLAAFSSEPKRTAPILADRLVAQAQTWLCAGDAGGYEFGRSQRFFHPLKR